MVGIVWPEAIREIGVTENKFIFYGGNTKGVGVTEWNRDFLLDSCPDRW